ncbi:DgyrCDS11499 [Dimorphilus gyrociliatus]|uniref:DgyrCDS11499 n=1 Tax=Dimorphilus gyrociliatus TaxID=2664684 RepID=A0A7I8W815_9ANNE|nr:DgyrCDS11499 [Dimorphilus gyrociliatus]
MSNRFVKHVIRILIVSATLSLICDMLAFSLPIWVEWRNNSTSTYGGVWYIETILLKNDTVLSSIEWSTKEEWLVASRALIIIGPSLMLVAVVLSVLVAVDRLTSCSMLVIPLFCFFSGVSMTASLVTFVLNIVRAPGATPLKGKTIEFSSLKIPFWLGVAGATLAYFTVVCQAIADELRWKKSNEESKGTSSRTAINSSIKQKKGGKKKKVGFQTKLEEPWQSKIEWTGVTKYKEYDDVEAMHGPKYMYAAKVDDW